MNSPKHVAYLSYDGLTDPLGQSQIIPYLTGLSKFGYRFTILSFEKKESFERSAEKTRELLSSHNIVWNPLLYTKWPPVLSTLWDIWKLWWAFVSLNKTNPVQLVHCRSYITALIGLQLKRKTGIRFLFDMRGFWADERVEGNIWNLQNPMYKIIYNFFKKKEQQFWQESDHIISLTENARQEMVSKSVLTPITVIPTCVDLNHFDIGKLPPDNRDRQREMLGVAGNSFLLVYSGSWGSWYLTDAMLLFFECLRSRRPDARFLILSPDVVSIPKELRQYILHKKSSRKDMPMLLACADACVFFIKPSYSKKASSATKLGEFMAMQLPVVTNGGWGDIQDYNSDDVMVVNDVSIQNLANAAKWITTVNRTGPNYHLEKVSLSHGLSQYQSVYKSLLV